MPHPLRTQIPVRRQKPDPTLDCVGRNAQKSKPSMDVRQSAQMEESPANGTRAVPYAG
jgi:hypothetical protein